MVFNNDV